NAKGVWFVGAASPGITAGVITAPQVDRTVEGQFYPKVIEFGSVSGNVAVTPGDSGSVLLAHRPADSNSELTVIGLVFAEWKVASTHGLAIPFWDIASKLGLTVSRPVTW